MSARRFELQVQRLVCISRAETNESASELVEVKERVLSMLKRILIVNDSHAVLHTLALILRRAGYDVDVASRRDTALAKAPQADVMLCDSVVGEDKNGSVARLALRRNKGLRVLLWVGGGEQSLESIKRHLSSFCRLPKPIDPPLLLEHLRAALGPAG